MLRMLVVAIAVMALMPGVALAQTVDDIVARNIQAHGGLEKLKSVQTLRIKGKYSAGSFRADVLLENKRPDQVRQETIIQGLAEVQAYDGKTGWQVNPFGGRKDPEMVSQDDLKTLIEQADVDGPLVDYKLKGHHAEFLGHESVEGTDCFKIKLTLKDGNIRTYYLDADSYLELKMESQNTVRGTIHESEMYFGDYEQVDGITRALEFETGRKGDRDREQLTFEKVEINVPLDDKRFKMPTGGNR